MRLTKAAKVRLLLLSLSFLQAGCDDMPEPCSSEWNAWLDDQVVTSDEQGHGPDVGSDEWRSVVEFRLGVRDAADLPQRSSKDWCHYVEERLDDMRHPEGGL